MTLRERPTVKSVALEAKYFAHAVTTCFQK